MLRNKTFRHSRRQSAYSLVKSLGNIAINFCKLQCNLIMALTLLSKILIAAELACSKEAIYVQGHPWQSVMK